MTTTRIVSSWLLVTLSLLPMALSGFAAYRSSRGALDQSIRFNLESLAVQTEERLERLLLDRQVSLRGWSQTRVDLSGFAGSEVKVRFRMGSDRKVGARGWYIDDIRIYTCAADRDKPTGTMTIDGGAPTTADRRVLLELRYSDPTTWVSHVRVSSSPRMKGGKLLKGITMEARETLAWDLADTTYGSAGARGMRRVYAQVRDEAGLWSPVFSDVIEWVAP